MHLFIKTRRYCLTALCLIASCPLIGRAQTFEESVRAARTFDAQYTAQLAAVQGSRVSARQAGSAFYPYANVAFNQTDISAGGNSTQSLSLVQPLLSYSLYLSLKSSAPLSALADAAERQAHADMFLRVNNSMAEIVRNRESIRALNVQIKGLQEQLLRSSRMRELGQGTVTEVSDFEVRLSVAQANKVTLQNNLQSAERNFTLLTNIRPHVASLSVEPVLPWAETRSLEELIDYARNHSTAAVTAQRNLELAEIAAKRVTAQFLPQVVAQVGRNYSAGNQSSDYSHVSVNLSVPLGASQYYESQKASTDITRAQETLRYAKDFASSETSRLYQAVISYSDEVAIRQRALTAAHLAVEGNEKSYQGGVKTNIDVLTSYQNLADAEVALVNSRLTKRDVELRLQILLDTTALP